MSSRGHAELTAGVGVAALVFVLQLMFCNNIDT